MTAEAIKDKKTQKENKPPKTFGMIIREWSDALIIAYVLAMFIRTFVGEPFKIPTGSMTPTLVGDRAAAEFDYDGNGEQDLILLKVNEPYPYLHVFYKKDGKYYKNEQIFKFSRDILNVLVSRAKKREDMIIVNKFAYWFKTPKRGDIVVFKVPDRPGGIWNRYKPIYIKRCVGLPGETITIFHPHLLVNGKMAEDPPVLKYNEYVNECQGKNYTSETVPDNEIYVFGDNSKNSLDSRYWGGVPIENLKGRAFIRYYPFSKFKFLK